MTRCRNVGNVQSQVCNKIARTHLEHSDFYFLSPSYPQVNWTLFQYKVDFTPSVENRRDRKDIVINELKDKLFAGAAVFDGMLLFSPIRVDMPARYRFSFVLSFVLEPFCFCGCRFSVGLMAQSNISNIQSSEKHSAFRL